MPGQLWPGFLRTLNMSAGPSNHLIQWVAVEQLQPTGPQDNIVFPTGIDASVNSPFIQLGDGKGWAGWTCL